MDTEALACNASVVQGRGARVKHPSQYVQHNFARERTSTDDSSRLPHRVQSATIIDIPEDDDVAGDFT